MIQAWVRQHSVKKISWDWANRVFAYFQLVFFVFLKFVKPGDVIEKVIISQNPFMKGLGITEQKLGHILQVLKSRCLLILDGLDEHSLGTNEDVLSIIRGEKYLKCNVIVTSRPHSTREIEKYFPTIVRLEGFTRNKAKEFASKILTDETVIEAVLNYNPGNTKEKKIHAEGGYLKEKFRDAGPIHKCPILLSFLCLLAREDNVDFLNTKMHTGEIYTRMVRCLYKKYVIRKGMPFDPALFAAAMTSVGKLALKTLLSGDPMLRRDNVTKEIGEDAFDYGLLIGHEDFRLCGDETADIFVTFPHRSIQEFLGALYFILMLNVGKEIQSLLGDKPIFLTNTLFLQFCLWLLCENQKYFTLINSRSIYHRMLLYCVDLLNKGELDMKRIEDSYPALDISRQSVYAKDKLRVSFLGDILAKCTKTSSLVLADYHAINQFLGFVKPNLKSITFIKHDAAEHRVSCFKSTEVAIEAVYTTLDKLSVILKHYNKVMADPVVRLYLGHLRWHSVKTFSFKNVKTFFLSNDSSKTNDLVVSPDFTELHLHAVGEVTLEQVINKLPNVNYQSMSHLSFNDCGKHIEGKVSVMFESVWPNLKFLSLLDTPLSEKDLEFLCLACNGPKKTLPNLTSICFSIPSFSDAYETKLFLLKWLQLKQLYVDIGYKNDGRALSRAIREHKLPNLSCLRIGKMKSILPNIRIGTVKSETRQTKETLSLDHLHNLQSVYLDFCIRHPFQIVHNSFLFELSVGCTDSLEEDLSLLTVPGFPHLTTLTLRYCTLKSEEMASLAQAKVKGGLPALKCLNISHGRSSLTAFKELFNKSCTWNELLSLDIRAMFDLDSDCGRGMLNVLDMIDYMNEIVSCGYLSSLQKLGINRFENRNVHWNHLETIFLTECKDDALRNIADTREKYLPALQTLCVNMYQAYDVDNIRTLSKLGVSCHKTCEPLGNRFSNAKCHCEL